MIDADNSGQITFQELKIGLRKFGANLNESEIYNLMQAVSISFRLFESNHHYTFLNKNLDSWQADIDNSGTIDYREFIAATLHLNKIQKEDHLYAAFSYFDKDGSGYITLHELQKACQEFGISDVHLEEIIKEADQNDVKKTSSISLSFSVYAIHTYTYIYIFYFYFFIIRMDV